MGNENTERKKRYKKRRQIKDYLVRDYEEECRQKYLDLLETDVDEAEAYIKTLSKRLRNEIISDNFGEWCLRAYKDDMTDDDLEDYLVQLTKKHDHYKRYHRLYKHGY